MSEPKATIDIAHVAKLARIALTPDEVGRFGAQLGAILEHARALEALPLDDVSATAQVIAMRNVDRDDVNVPSLDRALVLSQAPRSEGAFFYVPQIIADAP